MKKQKSKLVIAGVGALLLIGIGMSSKETTDDADSKEEVVSESTFELGIVTTDKVEAAASEATSSLDDNPLEQVITTEPQTTTNKISEKTTTTKQTVTEKATTTQEITTTQQKTTEQAKNIIIGNKNTKAYHRPTCSRLPKEKNRVYFDSEEEANAAGYDNPCDYCKP